MTDDQRMFIFTSAAAVIIFRAELSILLGFIALGQLVAGRLSLLTIICWGLPAAIYMLGDTKYNIYIIISFSLKYFLLFSCYALK